MILNSKYVLITPARNEVKYIKLTIESVLSQTVLPIKWAIISDNSTDGTDEVVQDFAKSNPVIMFIRNTERKFDDFRSKVYSFNIGCAAIRNEQFNFIGNVDSDVSFGKNYFENIIKKFHENDQLGIAGGQIVDVFGKKEKAHKISSNSVAGAVQMFRRQCFDDIEGYLPLPLGGIDTAAEIMARAKGWKVQTFYEFRVNHHKPMKTGANNMLHSKIRLGMSNYSMGYHPLFQVFSCILRIFEKPPLIGSIAVLYGFCLALQKKTPQVIPLYAKQYLQKEQMYRLFTALHFKTKSN